MLGVHRKIVLAQLYKYYFAARLTSLKKVSYLIIFFTNFKVRLGVFAYRAYLWSFFAHYKVTTNTTFPHGFFGFLKYLLRLYII
jgi:hypothetical protein